MTGKHGAYRYYVCGNRRRKGPSVCSAGAIRADLLEDVVIEYVEDRLLCQERLEVILNALLDRREERVAERRAHAAELSKVAAELQQRLSRLYEAIESGVADLNDPDLTQRINALKAKRDLAKADADHARGLLESSGRNAIPKALLGEFAADARKKMREADGNFRRELFQKFAQRVELHRRTIKIGGTTHGLLNALASSESANGYSALLPSVLEWLPE